MAQCFEVEGGNEEPKPGETHSAGASQARLPGVCVCRHLFPCLVGIRPAPVLCT